MDPTMVETYRFLRDHGKPISQQDAADYAKLRAPQPPSRALLKRIKRAQLGKTPQRDKPARDYAPETAETALMRVRNDFHKRVIADLGGSLTVKPSGPVDRPFVNYVPATRNEAMTDPAALLEAKWQHLKREQLAALAKIRNWQPDMFDILNNFGSFSAYRKEA